jgi:hypothetical protein
MVKRKEGEGMSTDIVAEFATKKGRLTVARNAVVIEEPGVYQRLAIDKIRGLTVDKGAGNLWRLRKHSNLGIGLAGGRCGVAVFTRKDQRDAALAAIRQAMSTAASDEPQTR